MQPRIHRSNQPTLPGAIPHKNLRPKLAHGRRALRFGKMFVLKLGEYEQDVKRLDKGPHTH
jgi:hypothetical protein